MDLSRHSHKFTLPQHISIFPSCPSRICIGYTQSLKVHNTSSYCIMLSSILTVALLSTTAFANPQEKRQATDGAQFTSAASELISKYIPSAALPALESSVSSAASVAKVTGEAKSLIYDALLASNIPGWFASAVPSAYTSQIAALEGDISALRGPASSSGGGLVPVVVPVTTTNSAGSTYTTSVTSSVSAVTTVTS